MKNQGSMFRTGYVRIAKHGRSVRRVHALLLSTMMVLLGSLPGHAQQPGAGPEFTGTGKTDYIPLWLSSTKLGSSELFQNSKGDVGVGTTTPGFPLDVKGDVNTATSFRLGGIQIALGNWTDGNAFLGFSGNETTTGTNNTSLGKYALTQNTSGIENAATGTYALTANTSGESNTADGYAALYSNTSGGNNTASGTFALYHNTTGQTNIAIGVDALLYNTTGSSNIAIGINAGTGTSTDLNNTTAIGYYATASENNALVLGSTASQNGVTNILVGIDDGSPTNILTVLKGGGPAIADGWSTYSSRRWKTNIAPLHNALGMVEQLRGVSYDLKDSGKHEIGVIAEEVGAVVPEVVTYEENGRDARGVDYSRLTALLIEATKEQQAMIDQEQQQIHVQQNEIKVQQARIDELTHQVRTVQAALQQSGRQRSEVYAVKANLVQ
jgi:trimeric autotransporter adhesin